MLIFLLFLFIILATKNVKKCDELRIIKEIQKAITIISFRINSELNVK